MNIASTIIMFLPRNVDINQLAELALSTSPPWSLEASVFFLSLSYMVDYIYEHILWNLERNSKKLDRF